MSTYLDKGVFMDDNGKPLIFSTQNGVNVLVAMLAPFIPGVTEFVAAHPEVAIGAFSLLNILWRTFITKKPITSLF